MTRKNGTNDDEQNKLMGKFKSVVPRTETGREYTLTVYPDGNVHEDYDLGKTDRKLAELRDEIATHFQNNYKGRIDIRIRLE